MSTNKFRKGFTLIELLVVIAIIGVLTTLVMANFTTARGRARDAQRKSDLNQIKRALRMYYNDQNPTIYPPGSGGKINACTPADIKDWGEEFSCGTMVYVKRLPQDSLFNAGTPTYAYYQTPLGQDFCMTATLENKSDSELAKSQTRCATACNGTGATIATDTYVVCAD